MPFTRYRTPTAYVYLQLTAYSVISKSAVKGTCVRHTGSPVPLLDPYLELAYKSSSSDFENSFYAEDRTADFSDAWSSANSGLKTQLGYEDCTAASLSSSVVPNWYLPSATASLSATLVKSSVPASHNHTTQIVILSVIVPTVALMIILVGFIAIRRYRKKRSQAVVTSQSTTTTDTQLYVDQKAELEDEERRKHELDGAGISYEMEGEDRIFEMPSGRDAETSVASIRATQELRGLEHSQELDVPGTAV